MYLVFDIGGTKTRLAYSKDLMTISEPLIFETPDSYEEGIKVFSKKAHELTDGKHIKAVAGGVPSPLDSDKAKMTNPPNIHDWKNKPLKADLEEALNTKVFLGHDASLVGLGEVSCGIETRGKNYQIAVYITVSTGVGGVRITNKRIDESALGFEIGHQIIIPEGLPCGCGGKGHLESYIGGGSLHRIYGKSTQDIHDPIIWDEISKYFAIGLNNTIVHWSPNIIIIGGGIAERIPFEKVKKYLKEYLTIFKQPPEIVRASLGDLGGLYGALEYLKQQS